jgi:hypothetical protein
MTTATNIEMLINATAENTAIKILSLLHQQQQETIIKSIRVHQEQEKERKKKAYLRNTKILMKHYPEFEAHVRGMFVSKSEMLKSEYVTDMTDEEFDELLISNLDEDVYVASIQRSKSRTMLLLHNIDSQLQQLKKICTKKGIIHKYQMLEDYYVNGYTQENIAEKYGCYVTQVSAWVNEMIQCLSKLLFGVDGIEDFM